MSHSGESSLSISWSIAWDSTDQVTMCYSSDSEQFLVDVSQDPASSRKIPVRSNRQHRPVSRSETLPHFKQDDPSGWDHGRHSSANSTFSPPTTSVDPKTGLRPLSMMRAASTGNMDHVHEVDKIPQDKNERRVSRKQEYLLSSNALTYSSGSL